MGKREIKEIHYRNMDGCLIEKSPMHFKCLYAVGQTYIHDYKTYLVNRVALADGIQHVNVEIVPDGTLGPRD